MWENILETLEIMGKGMLAIFIVMGAIFLSTKLLNRFTGKVKKDDSTDN
jgi:hypothetical protein